VGRADIRNRRGHIRNLAGYKKIRCVPVWSVVHLVWHRGIVEHVAGMLSLRWSVVTGERLDINHRCRAKWLSSLSG